MKDKLHARVIVIIVILTLVPCHLAAEVLDRIVAIVNDDVITLSEVKELGRSLLQQFPSNPSNHKLPSNLQYQILEELISRKLTGQEAARLGISVTEEEIDKFIQQIKKDNGLTEDGFVKSLTDQGVSPKTFRKQIEENILRLKLIDQEIKSKVAVSDYQLKECYINHIDEYGGYNMIKIQHILLTTPEGATEAKKEEIAKIGENIVKLIEEGNDFGALAKRYSEAVSASNGGDPGFSKMSEMPQYLRDIVAKMQPGDVSGVVETPIGFQIIKLVGRDIVADVQFEQVKDQIYRRLFEEEANRKYVAWLKELRDKSYIKILQEK
jgi:peptidyl-prolyl cis-trans isomerase SurA